MNAAAVRRRLHLSGGHPAEVVHQPVFLINCDVRVKSPEVDAGISGGVERGGIRI